MGKSIAIIYAKDGAKVSLFLASDDSSLVNGVTITADAGWTSH